MLTFFAILLAFFATSVRGDGIDGKIFGGGDYVDRRLTTVRADLLRSFSLLRKGEGKESFCAWTRCPAGLSPQLCDHLSGLNEAQVGQCRALAERIATRITAIPFTLTDRALTVPGPGGKPRPVAGPGPSWGPRGASSCSAR